MEYLLHRGTEIIFSDFPLVSVSHFTVVSQGNRFLNFNVRSDPREKVAD